MSYKELLLILFIPVLLYLIFKGRQRIEALYQKGNISYPTKLAYIMLVIVFPFFYFFLPGS